MPQSDPDLIPNWSQTDFHTCISFSWQCIVSYIVSYRHKKIKFCTPRLFRFVKFAFFQSDVHRNLHGWGYHKDVGARLHTSRFHVSARCVELARFHGCFICVRPNSLYLPMNWWTPMNPDACHVSVYDHPSNPILSTRHIQIVNFENIEYLSGPTKIPIYMLLCKLTVLWTIFIWLD